MNSNYVWIIPECVRGEHWFINATVGISSVGQGFLFCWLDSWFIYYLQLAASGEEAWTELTEGLNHQHAVWVLTVWLNGAERWFNEEHAGSCYRQYSQDYETQDKISCKLHYKLETDVYQQEASLKKTKPSCEDLINRDLDFKRRCSSASVPPHWASSPPTQFDHGAWISSPL